MHWPIEAALATTHRHHATSAIGSIRQRRTTLANWRRPQNIDIGGRYFTTLHRRLTIFSHSSRRLYYKLCMLFMSFIYEGRHQILQLICKWS